MVNFVSLIFFSIMIYDRTLNVAPCAILQDLGYPGVQLLFEKLTIERETEPAMPICLMLSVRLLHSKGRVYRDRDILACKFENPSVLLAENICQHLHSPPNNDILQQHRYFGAGNGYPLQYFLAWRIPWTLAGYSPWDAKSRTRLSN